MTEEIFEVHYDDDRQPDGERGERLVSSRRFSTREAAERYAAGVHHARFPTVHRAGKHRTVGLEGNRE